MRKAFAAPETVVVVLHKSAIGVPPSILSLEPFRFEGDRPPQMIQICMLLICFLAAQRRRCVHSATAFVAAAVEKAQASRQHCSCRDDGGRAQYAPALGPENGSSATAASSRPHCPTSGARQGADGA
eukprot:scaffold234715_cov27-Tisochrysis_lutea.AAC.4